MCTIKVWWAGRVIKIIHDVEFVNIGSEIEKLQEELTSGKFKYNDHSEKPIIITTLCVDVINNKKIIREVSLKA